MANIISTYIFKIKFALLDSFSYFIHLIAGKLNFPLNTGMPKYPVGRVERIGEALLAESKLSSIEYRTPPPPNPTNLWEVFFGNFPILPGDWTAKVAHYTENMSTNSNPYGFYVFRHSNALYLPDWLALPIQLHWDLSDVDGLEIVRETVYGMICLYYLLFALRTSLFWIISINPYAKPWIYIISLTDWLHEASTGFMPTAVGIDLFPTFFLAMIGAVGDVFIRLIFTTPYLASEGQNAKTWRTYASEEDFLENAYSFNPNITEFKHFPIMWYKYPIPNNLREYWYNERPDILEYFLKNYADKNIEFYPEDVVKNMYEEMGQTYIKSDSFNGIEYFKVNYENILHEVSTHIKDSIGFFNIH